MTSVVAKSLCFECKRPLVEIDNRGPTPSRLHDVQHLVVAQGGGPSSCHWRTCRPFND